MDAKHFDHLARKLSADGSRRGLLRLLGALPLFGWLTLFLTEDGAAKRRNSRGKERSKGRDNKRDKVGADNHKHEGRRRKHRNKGNHHHKDKDKNNKKKCKPESAAQTCDGTCGQVKNNCQKSVDCGSCACEPACAACQVCDEASQSCLPDPAQEAERCGGCRICADGECVIDASIVCTALDQCHEVGECDPATGECTNPRKPDDTPCDDGDACTSGESCQNGECVGTATDCSAESDVCNDGVCRPSDGACIKEPKQDGTGCNADNDSCTSGDSCQNGACTPGAGVDCSNQNDQCNRGVCRQSDGTCRKEPRPDGTPCGTNRECVNGSCEEVVCLALGEGCAPSDNECCGDAQCAEANCFETGERCCHGLRGSCSDDCECCGAGICERTADMCCHHTQGSCETTADCCQNVFNRQECIAGHCCALPEEPCEAEGDCCEGLCDPEDSVCTSCLALQRSCEDESQCCQRGGATHCEVSFDFNDTNCCRPQGGVCEETRDCCDGATCCNGICCDAGEVCVSNVCQPVCRAHGELCSGVPDPCCPGFECRFAPFDENRCRPVICWEFLETCTGSTRPCCEGECTTVIFGELKSCCSPEGGECDDLGIFFPGGHCCGTNVCNGANRCARCRQLGETCDGNEAAGNCCNSLDQPPEAFLRCDAGVCVHPSG
jgi:hypothetical protein